MVNIGGPWSSYFILKGFSVNSKSSTFGPKVLGLLFGLEKGTTCEGTAETSMGGGT